MPKGGTRTGAGRKPSAIPRIKKQYKIDEDLVEWLYAQSEAEDCDISALVNQALRGLQAVKGYPLKNISKKC